MLKRVSKTIKNETKEQKGGFISMLLGTLGASLLVNILAGKGIVRAGSGPCSLNYSTSHENKKLKRLVRAGYGNNRIFNAASSFNKLWNTKVLPEWTTFNGVYSRNSLPKKIKGGAYVKNLDEYSDLGENCLTLFCNKSEAVYSDSFGVEHVFEEIKEFAGNENVIANIFQLQANNSIICRYACIGFIDFMLAGTKLTDLISIFSPYNFKKNGNIILSYFKDEWN